MSIVIRLATTKDLDSIKRLLQRAKLNDDLVEQDLHSFLVTENITEKGNSIVAIAGIEVQGIYGFLRSFVMESETWNTLIGLELIKIALRYAKQQGCEQIYLLTSPKAVSFFQYLQFNPVELSDVPPVIQNSPHFIKSYQQNVVIMGSYKQSY